MSTADGCAYFTGTSIFPVDQAGTPLTLSQEVVRRPERCVRGINLRAVCRLKAPADGAGRENTHRQSRSSVAAGVVVIRSGAIEGLGKVMTKVVPCGEPLVRVRIRKLLPCFSMISRVTQRPRPVPIAGFVVKNGSQIRVPAQLFDRTWTFGHSHHTEMPITSEVPGSWCQLSGDAVVSIDTFVQ